MKRIPWNKGRKGSQVAWNKGLTKSDPRVKKYAEKSKESRKGIKLSKKHKDNIRKSLTGRVPWNVGIKTSEEIKEKIRNSTLGNKNHFYGRTHSKNSKRKMSKSRVGKCKGINHPNCKVDLNLYKKKIINEYLKGKSARLISKKYGVTGTTILNYLKMWNIKCRKGAYGFSGLISCNDGHRVRSCPELLIDNFLYENGISHEVEKIFDFKNKQYKCDFYLPELDLYIEYWGIYHSEPYLKRKELKISLYKKLNLKLFSINWNENPIDKLKPLVPLCAKKQKVLTTFK
jgi:hypothetical protein